MRKILASIFLASALLLIGYAPSYAQATRTWVSGVGDDANPCSRTAPCKTFAGAISKTAAGGEISVLDPGGYGAVTITKSMSIVSEGSEGSILGCGTNGININALATDVINLHGLFLEGCGNGINAINILSAKAVHIRKCLIRGFKGVSGTGIFVAPSSASINVYVSDCTLSNNLRGLVANPTGTGQTHIFLDRVVAEANGSFGVRAAGAATIYMSNSVVTAQDRGLSTASGGSIISYGNNAVINNSIDDGAPTSTATFK